MKEQLHTIPIHEVFELEDECPFCAMERDVEHRTIRYVVGPAATYMEPHVRAATGSVGFCGHHLKSLYDYGNQLGAAMILQTHMTSLWRGVRASAYGILLVCCRRQKNTCRIISGTGFIPRFIS